MGAGGGALYTIRGATSVLSMLICSEPVVLLRELQSLVSAVEFAHLVAPGKAKQWWTSGEVWGAGGVLEGKEDQIWNLLTLAVPLVLLKLL